MNIKDLFPEFEKKEENKIDLDKLFGFKEEKEKWMKDKYPGLFPNWPSKK